MDFHSLARRELQALCKKNKIAANITNIAMADALKALPHVEGMEELMNPSESETPQSPEKLVSGSPEIPRTACRTLTRRRPIKDEPESSMPLTRTRRGTRSRIAGEAEEQKKDLLETTAMPSSRKRGPQASARRKMEIQEANQMESSVQRVYSTRQSVRLAEKKMAELSLKERGRTEPIKIHDLSKEDSDDVQENKRTDSQTKLEEHSERTNDSGVVFGRKSFGLLENSSDLKDEVQENKNREVDNLKVKPEEGSAILNVVSVADEISNELIENEAYDENKGTDLQTTRVVGSERTDESDVFSGENSVLAIDLKDETIEKKGPDDFTVNMVLSAAEKSNEVLKLEKGQDLDADQYMGSDDSSTIKISGDVSSNIMDFVAPPQSSLPQEIDNSASLVESVNDSSGDSEKPELNSLNLIASADQLVVDGSDGDDLPEDQMVCSEQLGIEKVPEIPEVLDCKRSEEDFDQLVMDSKNVTDAIPSEATVDNELGLQFAVGFSVQESMNFDNVKASCHADNSMPEMDKTPISVKRTSPTRSLDSDAKATDEIPSPTLPADPMPKDKTLPETCIDVYECPPSLNKTPTSVKQMSPFRPLVSDGRDTGEIPFSNWAVDPLLGHIPRPTQLTPRKSSSKKQTTIQRVIHVSDDNKENIDNCGRKVELKIEKGKKIRMDDTAAEKSLHDESLGNLRKMLKEQLQIRHDINDDDTKNVSKQQEAKTTRPALQTLPENCMAAGEPGKEN